MIKSLIRVFSINVDLKPYRTPILGRWALHYDIIADKKADMTNEDHCGVCDIMRNDYLKNKNQKCDIRVDQILENTNQTIKNKYSK